MKISIWILKDWFKDQVKSINCSSGKMTLSRIKLYSAGVKMDVDTLYVGTSGAFFGDGSSHIVCKNRDDCLVLQTQDLLYVVNQIQDAFFFYERWDNQCRQLLEENGRLRDILDTTADFFYSPIFIVDAAQTFVAISSSTADFQSTSEWQDAEKSGSVSVQMLRNYNLAHPEVYSYTNVFPVPGEFFFVKSYCKHVFIHGERRATVILKVPGQDYSAGQLQLFEHLVGYVTEWINRYSDSRNSFQTNSYFARALDGQEDAIAAMVRQTALFGWEEKSRKVVFVLRAVRPGKTLDTRMIANLTKESRGTYAMIYKKDVVILRNADIPNSAEVSQAINVFLKTNVCYGGVSFPFTDMNMLPQSYKQVITTLQHSPAAPETLYHCQRNAMRRVAEIVWNQSSNSILHPAIAILKDYDLRNRTDYYKTLFAYLKNERSNQLTAEELFIHRNTLSQRLRKVFNVCTLDLDDPEERFYLLFSFYQDTFTQDLQT
ncbi:MAG: PucR family transcriptional regulator [Lachnospiraceae bacterium]|jgi:hypothetical protein